MKLAVPRVVPTRNQLKYIGCQTDAGGSFDLQWLSGALSNHDRCRHRSR